MMDIFYFDKTLKKGNIKDIDKLKGKKIWIDITDITKKEAELIKNTFHLHHLTTEDLLTSNVRIKVEEFPNYLFCVFYGIQGKKVMESLELDFIIGKDFIISNHKKDIPSYNDLKNNKEGLESLFKKGIISIFHRLLDNEVDNYFPILEKIDDQIEDIEEGVTKNPNPRLLTRILKLKRLVVQVRKYAFQQREKLSFLAKNEYKFIPKKSLPYFRDIYDHAIRVSDSLDNSREAISNTFDVYMSAMSNRMNEVMKVLSVIATIALPLTVISGIYGTNFSSLPLSDYAYGFWIMIFSMLLVCISMLYFFRRRGWF